MKQSGIVMSPIILRIRQIMVRLGDLPSVNADATKGLSNGAILRRLKEISDNPQSDTANNAKTSEENA